MHVFCIYLHNDLHLVCMCRPWGPISTIFKLLLSNSHSVEVPPGFMESNFHDSGLSPRPPTWRTHLYPPPGALEKSCFFLTRKGHSKPLPQKHVWT